MVEQALLSAGNMYLLKHDYDHAIDYFRELQQRFTNGNRASYAHWKAAWLSFRQNARRCRAQGFEDQIALYPDSNEIPAARYWRGAHRQGRNNPAMARAFYQNLPTDTATTTTPNSARTLENPRRSAAHSKKRLSKISEDHVLQPSLLDRVSALPTWEEFSPADPQKTICVSPEPACSRTVASRIWRSANCRPPRARKVEPGHLQRWPTSIRTVAATIR